MIPNWNVLQTPLRKDINQSDLEKVRKIGKTLKRDIETRELNLIY